MNIEWIKKRSQTSPPRSVVKLFCARAPRNRHINGLRPGGEEFSNGSRSEILPPFTVCMPFRSNLTSVSLTLPPLPLDLVTTIRSSTGTSRIFATFLHRMRHEHLSLSLSLVEVARVLTSRSQKLARIHGILSRERNRNRVVGTKLVNL